MVSQAHGTMDQWMVLMVVPHRLGPLGVRRHSEETIKGASAILMSKYIDDLWCLVILGYLWFLIVRHKSAWIWFLHAGLNLPDRIALHEQIQSMRDVWSDSKVKPQIMVQFD